MIKSGCEFYIGEFIRKQARETIGKLNNIQVARKSALLWDISHIKHK